MDNLPQQPKGKWYLIGGTLLTIVAVAVLFWAMSGVKLKVGVSLLVDMVALLLGWAGITMVGVGLMLYGKVKKK